jgi:hypothetical protein
MEEKNGKKKSEIMLNTFERSSLDKLDGTHR